MRPSPALFVLAALLATGDPALGDTAATCAECPLPLAQDLPIEVDPGFPVTVDLVTMIAKAGKDRGLLMMLENLIARRSNQNSLRMLEQVVLPQNNGGHDLNAAPYRYEIVAQVGQAQNRARILGEMLAADLNNDGQISRQELSDVLAMDRVNHVADAFFTSDKDGDNVLKADEIRAAATETVRVTMGDRDDRQHFAQVLDFDGDGYLSAEEYQRGQVAMGFPSL